MIQKLLIGIGVLVAIVILGLAIVLVPAHLQIRQVEAIIPPVNDLMSGEWLSSSEGPSEILWLNTASQKSAVGTVSHVVFLLRWEDGRSFMIDSGMNPADAIAFGELFVTLFGAAPPETYGAVETQMGDAAQNIQGIGFTHLHSDHTLGLTAICEEIGETATIFQTSDQASLQNLHTEAGQEIVNTAKCGQSILTDDIIKPIPGFPGLVAIAAGGHTPGSTIYAVRVEGKTWVFAGDITNNKNDLVQNKGKGVLYSYFLVPENTRALGQWRPWLAGLDARDDAEVIISHDLSALLQSDLKPWVIQE